MKKYIITALLILFAYPFLSAKEPKIFFTHGPVSAKAVSLTFDDGPGPRTQMVLDILAKYNIKATFFMQGSNIPRFSDVVQKVHAAGHEIGSHLNTHINFYRYKNEDYKEIFEKELKSTEDLINKHAGIKPSLLRMPNGYYRQWVGDMAGSFNYHVINWTFGCDWEKMPLEEMQAAYLKNIGNGYIFLFHDSGTKRDKTLAILPVLIEELQKRGYSIVTVSELLGFNKTE